MNYELIANLVVDLAKATETTIDDVLSLGVGIMWSEEDVGDIKLTAEWLDE